MAWKILATRCTWFPNALFFAGDLSHISILTKNIYLGDLLRYPYIRGQGYFRSVGVPLDQVDISYHILRIEIFRKYFKERGICYRSEKMLKNSLDKEKTLKKKSNIVCKEMS